AAGAARRTRPMVCHVRRSGLRLRRRVAHMPALWCRLLAAGVDTTVIALWLGHENVATTQIYIHADLALKEKALARTAPQHVQPGRYQPSEAILTFLDSL